MRRITRLDTRLILRLAKYSQKAVPLAALYATYIEACKVLSSLSFLSVGFW